MNKKNQVIFSFLDNYLHLQQLKFFTNKTKTKHMKKLNLLLAAMFVLFTASLKASTADLFAYNEQVITAQMTDLNELEKVVKQNEGVTLTELKTKHFANLNLNGLKESSVLGDLFAMRGGDLPLGIPAFVWGCVLGWVGILVVYLVTEDKEETLKALWGCLAEGAISAVLYIIYVVVIVAAATSTVGY